MLNWLQPESVFAGYICLRLAALVGSCVAGCGLGRNGSTSAQRAAGGSWAGTTAVWGREQLLHVAPRCRPHTSVCETHTHTLADLCVVDSARSCRRFLDGAECTVVLCSPLAENSNFNKFNAITLSYPVMNSVKLPTCPYWVKYEIYHISILENPLIINQDAVKVLL